MEVRTSGRRLIGLVTSEQAAAVALIIPSLVAVGVFVYGFIGWSALVSVSEWDTINPDYTYVGLDNFRDLFGNFRFQIDIRNTVVFTVFFVGACLGIGLVLASLLDRHIVGEGLFRSIFLFPMAVSFIVTGVVWRWLLAPRAGVNILPEKAGLGAAHYGWYTDPTVTYIHADSRLGGNTPGSASRRPNFGIPWR
jgi:glucose/mannose transport system permease protein